MTLQPSDYVWRYMSFAKFVFLLEQKQLWFSPADRLDDKWELMPSRQQLDIIIQNRHTSITEEDARDELSESVKKLRKHTYINCWTASDFESHALWRIYCPSSEGVAIQTTFDRLKKSVSFPVVEVKYDISNENIATLNAMSLVTQKRPMYSYEKEVRIVIFGVDRDPINPSRETLGAKIDWDPELHIENIWVHPEASHWFMKTVSETVKRLAPKISTDGNPRVWWSKINTVPPIK